MLDYHLCSPLAVRHFLPNIGQRVPYELLLVNAIYYHLCKGDTQVSNSALFSHLSFPTPFTCTKFAIIIRQTTFEPPFAIRPSASDIACDIFLDDYVGLIWKLGISERRGYRGRASTIPTEVTKELVTRLLAFITHWARPLGQWLKEFHHFDREEEQYLLPLRFPSIPPVWHAFFTSFHRQHLSRKLSKAHPHSQHNYVLSTFPHQTKQYQYN